MGKRRTRPKRTHGISGLGISKIKNKQKVSNKPDLQLAPTSHQATVTWTTPKEDYVVSITNQEQIAGGHAEFMGNDPESGIVIADLKEFDGDESHVLIQALPNDRETYIQNLEIEPEEKLQDLYYELSGEEPNPIWSKSTLIEAIAEERYNK